MIRVRLTAAALLCAGLSAHAQTAPEFKFSGFGTLAAAHNSEDDVDFVGTIFQPNGAGYTRRTSLNTDSKLGGQVTAIFGKSVSAVVQLVAQQQYDNSFKPAIEWANVKFQATPELSLRLGRIAAPNYLLSESRFVGYASPWVRPPIEVYSVLSITSNDGVDATYRSRIGGANNTVQAYVGRSTAKLSADSEVKSKLTWGINDTVEIGSLTLRAGYNSLNIDATIPSLDGLFGGLRSFSNGASAAPVAAFKAAGAQAAALIEKYKTDDMALKALALGASYDPGNWFVMSEFVEFKGDGFLSDSRSWYVSGGYRFGSVTPYLTHSRTKARIQAEPGISTEGAAPLAAGATALNGGIASTLMAFTPTQNTSSVGVRWDFYKNMALKAQYDHIKLGEGSHGRLKAIPGVTHGNRANVVSAALDFVF